MGFRRVRNTLAQPNLRDVAPRGGEGRARVGGGGGSRGAGARAATPRAPSFTMSGLGGAEPGSYWGPVCVERKEDKGTMRISTTSSGDFSTPPPAVLETR